MLGIGNETYKARRFSKNLFSPSAGSATSNGVSFTISQGGIITINGTATNYVNQNISMGRVPLSPVKQYTCSATVIAGTTSGTWSQAIRTSDSTNIVHAGETITATGQIASVYFVYIEPGAVFSNYTFRMQLEQGNTATAWDPY